MTTSKVEQKIQAFLKNNPFVKGKSQEEILSIMVDFGVITVAEKKNVSTFQRKSNGISNQGLVLEKESENEANSKSVELEITREDAQNCTINELGNMVVSADTLYENQKNTQGDISAAYDLYKEVTKDGLSKSKLEEAIRLEKLGYMYLNEARSNSLTKREYYEHIKEDLMLMTPGYNNFNPEQKAEYKARVDSLTIEEIKFFQKQLQNLPDKDSPEYNKLFEKFINNLKSMTETAPEFEKSGDIEVSGEKLKLKSQIRPPVIYSDADELIKFEEVFLYERGISFNKEKIARFENSKTALQLAQSVSSKADKIHKYIDDTLVNPRGDWQASDYAKVEMGLKLSLQELFGKDEYSQQEGLKKLLDGDVPQTEIEIARAVIAKIDENKAKVLNGKTLEDYQQEYADAYVEAYGRKNSEQLAKAYIEDNESIDERIAGTMQVGGMVFMAVGGVTCLIPGGQVIGGAILGAGGKLAMSGMVAQTGLGYINENSKSDGISDEAAERLTKDGLINLASFIIGAGAGIKGSQVGAALMAKGSGKFVALVGERGTDLAISMAGDMLLTGDLNIQGNMIGMLTSTLTGLKTGKTIAKDVLGHVPEKPLSFQAKFDNDYFPQMYKKIQIPEVRNILSDIKYTIENVKDKKLSSYLENSFKKITDGDLNQNEIGAILIKTREVIDVYNTVNRNYSNIGAGAEHQEFIKFIKNYYPELTKDIKNDAELETKILKNKNNGNFVEDFKNHLQFSKLMGFVKIYPNDELSDYFYNNYYLKQSNIPNSIKKQYMEINKKYNVKVFSSPLSSLDLKQTASAIEQELAEWHRASNGEAKYPPVIDTFGTKKIYYEIGAGAYAGEITHTLGINGMNAVVGVKNFLRHEITHINDKKITGDLNKDYSLPSDIAPYHSVNNPETGEQKMQLDFANCKYRDEFLKAGVEPSHVIYAYSNSKEFIAVAAEGDMSKYSPEFKELLIKMGMPEWQFNMKHFDPMVDRYIKNVENLIAQNPDKSIDKVIYQDKSHLSKKSSQSNDVEKKLSDEMKDGNEIQAGDLSEVTPESVKSIMMTPELYQRGFTEQRINSLMDSVKGNSKKLALLNKLLPLEHRQFDYSAIKNILDFDSDIPIEIIDKFLKLDDTTLAARGAELSAYDISFILRGLKTSEGKLIEHYQEVADFAYRLLSKKSNEGSISCQAICEIIKNFGVDERAADGVFELMSVDGMAKAQVSPLDAVKLYRFSNTKGYNISEIKNVLKLTPEQLKARGNRALTESDVRAILTYVPDKVDIVKDLISLQARGAIHQENASYVAPIIAECGNDMQRISDIKRLLSIERPLKKFSNETRHLDVLLANNFARDAFEGKVDTIEKLFLLEPKNPGEKWLPVGYFINSNEFIKNSKAVFDVAGDNYKNFSPQDIKIFADPKNVDNVTNILKENPKLTPDEIHSKLSDIKIKELNPLVKNKDLQSIARYIYNEHNNVKNHDNWKLIEDLEFKLENVGDKKVQDYLKNTFNEIDGIMKLPVNISSRVDVIEKLRDIDKILDVYHTITGHYTYAGIKTKILSNEPLTREFIDYVRKNNPQAAEELIKYATNQYGHTENIELNQVTENLAKDFMRDLRIERFKEYTKENPHNPLNNHFYEKYLLSFDSDTVKRCLDINKKYNTKIILSEVHNDYKTELDFIEAELNRWHEASEGNAIMPPVLDFSKCKKIWYADDDGIAAGYSELGSNKSISVSGMEIEMIQDVMRHEMTHSNHDVNVLVQGINKHDMDKIMPKKTIITAEGKSKEIPDMENCKYREEFLKAGIPPYHITYAYKDVYEFLAVASEGDMSKYSPEFKQLLKDLGMPEWQLKMDCVQPENIKRAQMFDKITKQYQELKTYDELYAMEGLYRINEMLPENKKWNPAEIKERYDSVMNEISDDITVEDYISALEAEAALHIRPMLSDGINGKVLPEAHEDFLHKKASQLHKKGIEIKDKLVKALFDAGLGDKNSMSYRVKGVQSLFDKLKNYLFDNQDKPKNYFDAEDDVRDLFAARTIVESGKFAKHPDVVKLLNAGDTKGAVRRAAELQSQPTVEKIKALLDRQAKAESDIELTRISNYKGADGIPYLSEAQLADIKKFALDRGIKLDFVTRIEPDDPMYNKIDAKAHNKKAATKVRDSGYTALQLNFRNKADGQIFEWQYRGDKVTVFAEAEHVPYDLRTGKDIISAHPELEPLYTPIKELLSKDIMTEEQFNNYNKYLTAHYEYLRKRELGFDAVEPSLEDFGNFDQRLSARNLELLHDVSEKLKNGEISADDAVKLYNDNAFKNIQPKEKTYSELLNDVSAELKNRFGSDNILRFLKKDNLEELKQLEALLNVKNRQKPYSQGEIIDIFFDPYERHIGKKTIKTQQLIDFEFLGDLPARKKPMNKKELAELSKLSDEEMAEVKKYNILASEKFATQPVTASTLRSAIAENRPDPDRPLKKMLQPLRFMLNNEFYNLMKDVYAKNGDEVTGEIVETFNNTKCLGSEGFVKILKESEENGKIDMDKLKSAVDIDVKIFNQQMEKDMKAFNDAKNYLKKNTGLNDIQIENIADAVNIKEKDILNFVIYCVENKIPESSYLSLLYACDNNNVKISSALYGMQKGIELFDVRDFLINSQDIENLNLVFDRIFELKKSNIDLLSMDLNKSVIEFIALQSNDDIDYFKSMGLFEKSKNLGTYKAVIDFKAFKDVKDILELTYSQKRELLNKITKYNNTLLDDDFKNLNFSEVLPKTKDEYCSFLVKLTHSIGISTKPLSDRLKTGFENALDNLTSSNGVLSKVDFDSKNFKAELDYPREKFIEDMQQFFNMLPKEEALKIMDYYGFEFRTLPNGMFQMNGYPNLYGGSEKLSQIKEPKTRAIIEEMKPYVRRFSENNKLTIKGEPELSQQLNDIIKVFPEFLTTIGKAQHKTHDYTVDVHTLKVLQGVVTNPKFQSLSQSDKRVLSIATIFHDITKAENLIDKTHPAQSAYDAYHILGKMNLPEAERLKIYQIIKNHDWLEHYNKKIKNPDGTRNDISNYERIFIAKNIAFELRQGNSFELASILAEADLKGVKSDGSFFDRYKDALKDGIKQIGKFVSAIQATAIHLPQSKIPLASDIKPDGKIVKEMSAADGTKNTVIFMDKGIDLSKYGFPEGMSSDDFNIIVHALDSGEQSAVLNALGQVDTSALLSASFIMNRKGNYLVFRKQGFILDVASDDIHVGYYRDFGSGYKKNLDLLINQYLFGGRRKEVRTYFSDLLKKELKLSDEEYKDLYAKIANKSIDEIQQIDPKVADAYRKIFDNMEVHKRQHGRNYNEILISRPKIQGVFAYGKDYESIPKFLREYAEANNLPIIIFGK